MMPEWLSQYWIVILVAAALVVLAVVLFVPRRDPRPPEVAPPETRKPLEPRKPEIAPARANDFARVASAEADEAPGEMAPPVVTAPPATHDADGGAGDDLAQMKGVGSKLVAKLNALGIARFSQIAAWTDADIDRIDAELGPFAGRIRRDEWVEQARLLAAGDKAGFEARFGALG